MIDSGRGSRIDQTMQAKGSVPSPIDLSMTAATSFRLLWASPGVD